MIAVVRAALGAALAAVCLTAASVSATAAKPFVNDDLAGGPLVVTIAHEIGHAFGLVHVSDRPSVMNVGNLVVEPNTGDVTALVALWSTCDAGDAPSN